MTGTPQEQRCWRSLATMMMSFILIGVVMVTASKLYLKRNGQDSGHQEDTSADDIGQQTYFVGIFGRSIIVDIVVDAISTLVACVSIWNFLQGVVLTFVSVYLYRQLFQPYVRVQHLGDIGYITGGRDKREVANEIRRRRRVGDVPPIYPNGWFSVLRSRELNPGDVKYVSALGK